MAPTIWRGLALVSALLLLLFLVGCPSPSGPDDDLSDHDSTPSDPDPDPDPDPGFEFEGDLNVPDLYVAQWITERFLSSATVTFQLVLHEASGDIEIRYQDINFANPSYDYGASATVGIQAGSIGPSVEYSCNTPSLSDGLALRFYRL